MTTFVPTNQDPTSTGPVPGGEDAPTDSHALATADPDEETRGMVHEHAELNGGIKDLGWHEDPENVPAPLVGRLPNDELWVLIRRFNKQMYHIKSIPHAPPGGLDLNVAAEDEFSPDKLRSNVERLYMTVIVDVVGAAKHIARLRSWKETKRTAAFFAAYSVAWAFDFVMPLILATIITLMVVPRSRRILFPPAPIALIDARTGGVKKPTAGMLGSHGSLTGAPEKHHGEAVEQEAHNFVSSFGAIALSSAAGKGDSGNPHLDEDSATEKTLPDPTDVAMKAADAKKEAKGEGTGEHHDKAKKPMETAMWEGVRPVMHAVGDVADVWERFANALSPTPPFPRNRSRMVLASVVGVVLLVSLFATPYMVVKGGQFVAGAGFFGDPLFQRGLAWLNANIPNWMEYLDIRNNLLKGVPTNAQLTLTLLRLGEAHKAPLPPPPSSGSADDIKPIDAEQHENLPADSGEIADAMHPEPSETNGVHKDEPKKHKPGHKLLSFFKGTTKAGVGTALSTDPLKASLGSKKAQNRLGAVTANPPPPSGPVTFPARLRGKRGTVFVNPENGGVVAFAYDKNKGWPEFEVPVGDVVELKKAGGLGWKSKLVVGWSMNRDVVDGIEIVVRDKESQEGVKSWFLTAVGRRDELFNRLIAMGGQKWESW